VLRLASCQWIRESESVLVSGATGTGSYLTCALVNSACRRGLSTRHHRFSRLLGNVALARADGSTSPADGSVQFQTASVPAYNRW
jgi:DNA replication protein DnaC